LHPEWSIETNLENDFVISISQWRYLIIKTLNFSLNIWLFETFNIIISEPNVMISIRRHFLNSKNQNIDENEKFYFKIQKSFDFINVNLN